MNDKSEAAIFEAALACVTPQERAAYLDKACAGQPELRQRVEALLAAHEEASKFLEPKADVPRPTIRLTLPEEQVGERIGRYKLLQKIGEGGCGVVYMAEQEEPVRRRVALKVIKLGMDTKQVVARFEAERQALALMDHPNIAKVLDAGATDQGRPFFVMELVKGIPVTRYCDENKLTTRQRLDLFIQICQAVQHAHQKGIIHRDLKPSNVLVADHDGTPVSKVIDFGIAKATTDQRLTDKTLFTAFEQFIGTPAYMSPEQAKLSGLDIDTRSDIYSLGVLLYELLTGKTPFDARRLLDAGFDEIRRIIREEEPVKPSTRLTQELVAADVSPLQSRAGKGGNVRADSRRLLQEVEGDLDWIVMKALEKDRTRRYETANGLAADVQRHLGNEPVVACPPSATYRLQKMVRRNKQLVAATAAVVGALFIGVSFTTWQAIRAVRSEHEQSRLRILETELRKQAEAAGAAEKTAREKAESETIKTQKLLLKNYMANAELLTERGDLAGSLVWLLEALKLVSGKDSVYEAARIEIRKTLTQLPMLCHAVYFQTPQSDPQISTNYSFNLDFRKDGFVLSPDRRYHGIIGKISGIRMGQKTMRNYVIIRDALTGKQVTNPITTEDFCHDLAFSAGGKYFALATSGGIAIHETYSGVLVRRIEQRASRARFNQGGRQIIGLDWTVGRSNLTVSAWDLFSGEKAFNYQTKANPAAYVTESELSPGGCFVYYQTNYQGRVAKLSGSGAVAVEYSLDYGKTNLGIAGISEIGAVTFSPNEDLLACRYKSGQLQVFDLQNGNVIQTSDGFPGDNFTDYSNGAGAVFSGDSSRLATWGNDSVIKVWDTISWEPLGEPIRVEGKLQQVVVSPSGQVLATVSDRRRLRLWDVMTGKALTAYFSTPEDSTSDKTRHADFLTDRDSFQVLFSLDEKFLLASGSHAVWAWRNPVQQASHYIPDLLADLETWVHFISLRQLGSDGALEGLNGRTAQEAFVSWKELIAHQFPSAHTELENSLSQGNPNRFHQRSNWSPARAVETPGNLIDLSHWFNHHLTDGSPDTAYRHNLAGLDPGIKKLAGVSFDVRGIIQLSGQGLAGSFPDAAQYRSVRGIPINRLIGSMHVLHGTSFSENDGVAIGCFVLHYVDGQQREIPVVYGVDVRDYWYDPDKIEVTTNSSVAWTGSNEQIKSKGKQIRLFKSTWNNPLPNLQVESVDYISRMSGASPFLIGLTVE